MADYIEREKLIDDIQAAMTLNGLGMIVGGTMLRYIKRVEAAEVAPVVRCKDCKHWKVGDCFLDDGTLPFATNQNDFCSHGEKMDGDTDGSE